MFDFPALLPGHSCSPSLNDAAQATVAIIGVIACILTVLVARRAYHRSYKATEINDEHVTRFIEAAPLWRLKDLHRTDGKGAEEPNDPCS